MRTLLAKARAAIDADFLSPKDLVRRAVLIIILFAIAHALGLRDYTAIVSGTMASPALGVEICAVLGMGYLVLYFGAVVLAPVLLIAAALLFLWKTVRDSSRRLLP